VHLSPYQCISAILYHAPNKTLSGNCTSVTCSTRQHETHTSHRNRKVHASDLDLSAIWWPISPLRPWLMGMVTSSNTATCPFANRVTTRHDAVPELWHTSSCETAAAATNFGFWRRRNCQPAEIRPTLIVRLITNRMVTIAISDNGWKHQACSGTTIACLMSV